MLFLSVYHKVIPVMSYPFPFIAGWESVLLCWTNWGKLQPIWEVGFICTTEWGVLWWYGQELLQVFCEAGTNYVHSNRYKFSCCIKHLTAIKLWYQSVVGIKIGGLIIKGCTVQTSDLHVHNCVYSDLRLTRVHTCAVSVCSPAATHTMPILHPGPCCSKGR